MASLKPVRLAYNTYEPATGADEKLAPIIYLHGVTAVKEYWLDIPQKVADVTKRKTYTVDARNHGDSEESEDFTFDLNVVDLLQFMDSMGIQKAVLIGHSMGGITSIRTALKKPDRVESLIVEDMYVRKCPQIVIDHRMVYMKTLREALATIPTGLGDDETFDKAFQQMIEKAPPEMAKHIEQNHKLVKSSIGKLFFKRNDEGRLTMKYNTVAVAKCFETYQDWASEPEGIFDGPALFIYGTLSPFKVGDEEEHIKQFFPNAVLKGIEEDHTVHIPKNVEFTDEVLKFLS